MGGEQEYLYTDDAQIHNTASVQNRGLDTHIKNSIQLIKLIKPIKLVVCFLFEFKCERGFRRRTRVWRREARPLAARPAVRAAPPGEPPQGASAGLRPAGQQANHRRRHRRPGERGLGERVDVGAIARWDDAGGGERGGRQDSDDGEFHGSAEVIWSAMVVETRDGTVPGWMCDG